MKFNPYAYEQPAQTAKDTLDAIQRICQLHWGKMNTGDAERIADFALREAAAHNTYPIDEAIDLITAIDRTMDTLSKGQPNYVPIPHNP